MSIYNEQSVSWQVCIGQSEMSSTQEPSQHSNKLFPAHVNGQVLSIQHSSLAFGLGSKHSELHAAQSASAPQS